jgi:hypothetical protein
MKNDENVVLIGIAYWLFLGFLDFIGGGLVVGKDRVSW